MLEMAEYKETGRCRALVATGCLTQRYPTELAESLPEVDLFIGQGEYPNFSTLLHKFVTAKMGGPRVIVSDPGRAVWADEARYRLTPAHYAYLRISEGCDNVCTFCSIPSFRGKLRSKPIETLVRETQSLVADGAREILVISQDTSDYGRDIYDKRRLADLVRALDEVEGVLWYRLLYLYPAHLPDDVIDAVAESSRFAHYLDMPIQHISAEVLKRMKRKTAPKHIRDHIARFREAMPEVALRTTVIVGFPGETEEDFQEMLDFLVEARFER